MFISEPIEFCSPDEPVPSRAVGAVIALVAVGIVLLAAVTALSAGAHQGHVSHSITTAASSHLTHHIRLAR